MLDGFINSEAKFVEILGKTAPGWHNDIVGTDLKGTAGEEARVISARESSASYLLSSPAEERTRRKEAKQRKAARFLFRVWNFNGKPKLC